MYPSPTTQTSGLLSDFMCKQLHNPARGLPVSERIVGARHGLVGFGIVEQGYISETIRAASVPTSFAVPAATPSGRQVVSRMTNTGSSEERRVGKEGVRTCRYLGSRYT